MIFIEKRVTVSFQFQVRWGICINGGDVATLASSTFLHTFQWLHVLIELY